jgi:hypothetical protein
MAVLVQREARVVVRIVDTLFVVDNRRPGNSLLLVVVVGRHRQEIAPAFFRPAVDKERLLDFGRIDGDRHVIGGVRAQARPNTCRRIRSSDPA